MNTHLKLKKRIIFPCFIHKCDKTFLYTCTLKKHFNSNHEEEYKKLIEEYPNQNFFEIFKEVQNNRNLDFENFDVFNKKEEEENMLLKISERNVKNLQEENPINNINNNLFLKESITNNSVININNNNNFENLSQNFPINSNSNNINNFNSDYNNINNNINNTINNNRIDNINNNRIDNQNQNPLSNSLENLSNNFPINLNSNNIFNNNNYNKYKFYNNNNNFSVSNNNNNYNFNYFIPALNANNSNNYSNNYPTVNKQNAEEFNNYFRLLKLKEAVSKDIDNFLINKNTNLNFLLPYVLSNNNDEQFRNNMTNNLINSEKENYEMIKAIEKFKDKNC